MKKLHMILSAVLTLLLSAGVFAYPGGIQPAEAQAAAVIRIYRPLDGNNRLNEGDYYIRNAYSGSYLHINGAFASGTKVVISQGAVTSAQQWTVKKIGNDYYTIQVKANKSYALDITNGTADIFSCSNPSSPASYHQWNISTAKYGAHRLTNRANGDAKFLTSASLANGISVTLSTVYSSDLRQYWVFEPVGNSNASVQASDSVDTGKHMDIYNDSVLYRSQIENAKARWNRHLRNPNSPYVAPHDVIRTHSSATTLDVVISDVYYDDVRWFGQRRVGLLNDTIVLNEYMLGRVTNFESKGIIENTVMHELGHALGIGHTPNNFDIMCSDETVGMLMDPNISWSDRQAIYETDW